jgi:2-dehydro-3-deoxygluconokinase
MTRCVTLGEILLRLKSPGHERLLQSGRFEASFGGAEANVAVALAGFGLDATFVTALPDNDIGHAAIASVRQFGVDVSQIVRTGERIGIYFLEAGANQRPGRVVYDRSGSAISTVDASTFDWPAIFADAGWLHVTGITPALSPQAAALTAEACHQARAHGATISCDLNYRSALWRYGRSAVDVMTALVADVDVLIGGREDCRACLGIDSAGDARDLCERVHQSFPNLAAIGLTLREAQSADSQCWSACLLTRGGFFTSARYAIADVVDRVGSGDAFSAGLIYGLTQLTDPARTLDFATAAGCLKHSIVGDFNRITADEVEQLLAGDRSGRLQR